jgi:hypothetical protein
MAFLCGKAVNRNAALTSLRLAAQRLDFSKASAARGQQQACLNAMAATARR